MDEAASVDNLGGENGVPQPLADTPPIRIARGPEKGRPPPGGEEAEVVVYQPRGVGLMHTRHKPSNAHYTHGMAEGCKCCLPEQAPDSNAELRHRNVSWPAILHTPPDGDDTPQALCWAL